MNEFYPKKAFINGITNAQNAVVSFTADHDFTVGENVGFRVTRAFGMYELDRQIGKVLGLTETTITVNLDTSTYTPFTYANLNDPGTTPPCCVPSSSGVVPYEYTPTVNLADSFDNRP